MGQGMLRGSKVGLTPQSHQSITLELAPDGVKWAKAQQTVMAQPSLGLWGREGGISCSPALH